MENKFNLNLIKSNHCLGLNFYSGSITLEELSDNYDVPIYSPGAGDITEEGGGYQRIPKEKRVNDVKDRISKLYIETQEVNTEAFVDNVNLNLRSESSEDYLTPINKSKTGFGDVFTFPYISDLGKFMTVDGQTRIKGALRALRDAYDNKDLKLAGELAQVRLQFSLTFCEDVFKEAYIFYLINNYAKSIPPAGALRLLHEGKARGLIRFVNEVTRAKKEDLVESMHVAQRLFDTSEVWQGNINDFNASGGGRINIDALSRIIVPLQKLIKKRSEGNGSKKAEEITAEVVEAFWCGLKDIYPQMFDNDEGNQYNILKAGSAEVMMLVLENIYTLSTTKDLGLMTDRKTFAAILKKLLERVKERNFSDTANVKGADLFLIGKAGAMARFGNAAAKKEFAIRVNREFFKQNGLPVP